MKKTKMLILLLIIALTISVLPVSYTEAASNKTQVKKAVNNYFKFGKKLNLIKMRNYFWDSSKDNEDDLDLNNPLFKFHRKQNKKYFKYKIKSVSVKGSRAKVKLKVTYRSFKKATAAAYEDTIALSMKKEIDDDKLVDYLLKYIKVEAKKKKPKTITKTFTLKLKKKNNKWKINDDNPVILDVVTCDFISAFMDLFSDLNV